MINFIKKNKVLSTLIVMTIVIFIIGLLFHSILDKESKEIVTLNINNFLNNIKSDKMELSIRAIFFNNFLITTIIWLLGISIIGIFLILLIYLFKVFIFSFELVSLLTTLKFHNILFIIIYLLPSFLNIAIYFLLSFFAINFSFVLIRILFLKKEYNINIISKKYLKIFIVVLVTIIITSLLEAVIIPKLLVLLY